MTIRSLAIFVFVFLSLPWAAGAAVGASAIKTWNAPVPGAAYGYTDPVVFEGTVEVPEDWFGRIRVFRDNVHLPQFDRTFSNFDNPATVYPFTIDAGAWPSGDREAEIRFDGADECRLVCADGDAACIAQSEADAGIEDWCARDVNNQSVDQIYPSRDITIGPPPTPILSVTPTPLEFWSHIQGSGEVTKTITITNTGGAGTRVAGSVTRTSAGTEFYCKSNCTYSLLPTDPPHVVTIAFVPPSAVGTYSGEFSLSCGACPGGDTVLPVSAETTSVPGPAVLTPDRTTVSFGSVPLGMSASEYLYISNTGDTPTNGTINLPANGQFRCAGSCTFSLNPGEEVSRQIYYEPTFGAPPPADAVAVLEAVGAESVDIDLVGSGNVTPETEVWFPQGWFEITGGETIDVEDYTSVNIGEPAELTFQIYNGGGGLLEADVVGLPSGDGAFTCMDYDGRIPDDCALATGIDYWGIDADNDGYYDDEHANVTIKVLVNDANTHTVTIQFRNRSAGSTQPPTFLTLRVTANDQPIAKVGGGYGCFFRYGNVLVGRSSLPLYNGSLGSVSTCTIQNVGAGMLDVTLPASFTRSGPAGWDSYGDGLFECVTGPGLSCGSFSLGPSQSAAFQYRFTAINADSKHDFNPLDPAYGGPFGFVGFPSTDSLHFHGVGVLLRATATPTSVPPRDFGSVNLGATSPYKTFDVKAERIVGDFRDIFSSSLPGATMNYSVQNSPHFRCILNCSGTINPNSSIPMKTARIVFEPGMDVGTTTEVILVNYDFGTWTSPEGNASIPFTLTGYGNDQPVLSLSGEISPPSLVDFGTVNIGEPLMKSITITNAGLGTLSGDFATFPAPFSCVYGCGHFDIPTNSSINVTLEFNPTDDIFYEESVAISSNGGNRDLTLRGFGREEPELSIDPAYLNFDLEEDGSIVYTAVGEVKNRTFTIKNAGLGTMIGSVSFLSPTPHFFLPPQNFSLGPNEEQDITVQFSPLIDGLPLNAAVVIDASDGIPGGWMDSAQVSLIGTGQFAALLDFRGTEGVFGPVVFGRQKELAITIVNLGARPIGQGTFEFPTGSPFSCVSPIGASGKCEYDIPPYGEVTFVVRFAPQGLGSVTSEAAFSSLPGYGIDFTGTGVPPQFKYVEE